MHDFDCGNVPLVSKSTIVYTLEANGCICSESDLSIPVQRLNLSLAVRELTYANIETSIVVTSA